MFGPQALPPHELELQDTELVPAAPDAGPVPVRPGRPRSAPEPTARATEEVHQSATSGHDPMMGGGARRRTPEIPMTLDRSRLRLLGCLLPTALLLLSPPAFADTEESPPPEAPPETPEAPAPATPETSAPAPVVDAPPLPPAPEPTFTPGGAEPLPLSEIVEMARAWTVRLVAAGRVGGGVLVEDGTHVLTLLHTVNVGYPVAVVSGEGHGSLARLVAWDRLHGLALLKLDNPVLEIADPVLVTSAPARGDAAILVGHGGSVGLSIEQAEIRDLTTWSPIVGQVASTTADPVDEDVADLGYPDFLIDRRPGDGDSGGPVVDDQGRLLGLVRRSVVGGGDRTLVTNPKALAALLAAPRDRRYVRPTHLQSLAGGGLAAHNRPSIVGGFIRLGLRVAIIDSIKLEPWFEAAIGTRAPFSEEQDDGTEVYRDRDLWWSLDVGLDLGWRLPIPVEGSRDYIVPTIGLRAGWNRFQNRSEDLVADCAESGGCRWEIEHVVDQVRSTRVGLDLGADVQHGPVRFGYRFFVDPTAPAPHSMHRLLITLDGLPLNIAIGDSR